MIHPKSTQIESTVNTKKLLFSQCDLLHEARQPFFEPFLVHRPRFVEELVVALDAADCALRQ